MGSGASSIAAAELSKPQDASDLTTAAAAADEVRRLRGILAEVGRQGVPSPQKGAVPEPPPRPPELMPVEPAGGGVTTSTAIRKHTATSAEPRKADPRTLALRTAQRWRHGRLPQWALDVPLADLEEARAAIVASGEREEEDDDEDDEEEEDEEVEDDDESGEWLHRAVWRSEEGKAKALIAAGASINYEDQ